MEGQRACWLVGPDLTLPVYAHPVLLPCPLHQPFSLILSTRPSSHGEDSKVTKHMQGWESSDNRFHFATRWSLEAVQPAQISGVEGWALPNARAGLSLAWGGGEAHTWFSQPAVFTDPHFPPGSPRRSRFPGQLHHSIEMSGCRSPQLVVTAREVAFLLYYIVSKPQGAHRCR